MEATHPTQPPATRRKRWLPIAAILVVVAGGAEIGYWLHGRAAERRQAELDGRAAKITAAAATSKDYATAGAQFKGGQFDPETVRKAIAAEIQRQAWIRVTGYFDVKTPAERAKYIDKVIDEELAYRNVSRFFRGPSSQPSVSDARKAMVQWTLTQPPITRVKMAEFGAAWTARMQQRGLPIK